MILNNFISGGQIFLHKLRMFKQIMFYIILISLFWGYLIAGYLYISKLRKQNLTMGFSYAKAMMIEDLSVSFGKSRNKSKLKSKNILFNIQGRSSYQKIVAIINEFLVIGGLIAFGLLLLIFIFWVKFGQLIKKDRLIEGGKILFAEEVAKYLKEQQRDSKITIGKMPLVRDSETKHILVTGATGSGKTNLIHNILPQIVVQQHPVIVIDQTGEMVAKYYQKERGDVIFNPFDKRSHNWDFWQDCFDNNDNGMINDRLENFAKILFSFNRKKNVMNSDPFWENSAEVIFTCLASYLKQKNQQSIKTLNHLLRCSNVYDLRKKLSKTPAARYLDNSNNNTASSILSVMATSAKPLGYLEKLPKKTAKFSLTKHFYDIKHNKGKGGWLFLATNPSKRELTLPLISCLVELSISLLMEIGIDQQRRCWFVVDELANLGKLPALNLIMTEGRKYGACVLAGMQSINQLFENYGNYSGNIIFGQFGTKFFFRNSEPTIAKIISELCGTTTISRQQKNISFGANDFRDGISYTSYTEQEKNKLLVKYQDLAKLNVGQCFVLLPETKVRLAKLQVPKI